MAACQDDASCVSNNTNYITVGLFKIDTLTNQPQGVTDTFRHVSIRTLQGENIFTDSTLLSSFRLPLNPSADQAAFIIQQDTVTDTIQFSYAREQQIISPECGVDQQFYALQVAANTFDSARVVETEVDKFNTPQVSIYSCRYSLNDTLKIRFFTIEGVSDTIPPITPEVDTVSIASVVNDRGTVLYENTDSLTSLLLPVYPDGEQIGLTITRRLPDSTLVSDQVVLSYQIRGVQVAMCLPQRRYDQLDVVSHTLDSIVIENRTLDRNNAGNLQIFF